MAESRLITISQAEISPNPVQVNKSYVIRVTIANRAYGLDYPYNYPYDYTPKRKGDQSMSVKTVQAVVNGQSITLTYNSTSGKWEATTTAPAKSSYTLAGHYYPVTVKATDEAGNRAYMATILYTVDLEKLRYEIKMLDYSAQGSMRDFKVILEKLEGSVTSVGNTENVSG